MSGSLVCHIGLEKKTLAFFKTDGSSTLVRHFAYKFCDFVFKGTDFTDEKCVL